MSSTQTTPKSARNLLPYGSKYDTEHARGYFEKHQSGFGRKFSTWRERGMVRTALKHAGNPMSVLDMPCGTGRFWPVFAEQHGRKIFAADLNQPMLRTGLEFREKEIVRQVRGFAGSAFSIPLRDNAVETVVAIRLLHHFNKPTERARILCEFRRVASKTVIITLWIDGNWKGNRALKKELAQPNRKSRDRFVFPRAKIEAEFREAGLEVSGCVHFLKFYSMWAAYVLRKV